MARITCAISGIKFDCSFLADSTLAAQAGYYHPIFAFSYHNLHSLYRSHLIGKLTSNDSYLLFIAFLHSSGAVHWKHPATLNPNTQSTKQLVENNLAQLIEVLEKSAVIVHPTFKQPQFVVQAETALLDQIPAWIEAWDDNIESFKAGRISLYEEEKLKKVENKLERYILSASKQEDYADIVGAWADKAGSFPTGKSSLYIKTIASCFDSKKMFDTPLATLKEIKDYCECNIEAGSIHFHTLMQVLNEGMKRHVDYLGGSNLAINYILLPSLVPATSKGKSGTSLASHAAQIKQQEIETRCDRELVEIIKAAPKKTPIRSEYGSSLEFIKAKLAYRVAATIELREEAPAEAPAAPIENKNKTNT